MKNTQYLLVINYMSRSILQAAATLRREPAWADLEMVLLARHYDEAALQSHIAAVPAAGPVHIVTTAYESNEELSMALAPFRDNLAGVICRSDKHIQDLRRVVPVLPQGVRTSSVASLTAATNKRLMREAFQKHAPEITPRHLRIHDTAPQTIEELERVLHYPVIVKPANLASSLLIQSCESRQELKAALQKVFDIIEPIYRQEERRDMPEVIVEEYLEGEFYSIDAYVLTGDEIYTCPPVSYIPAKQIGIDDFFLYKRTVPTRLTAQEIAAANEVAKKAVRAIGLEYSSVHVELVLTRDGWKIIELGPRLGRFRVKMYHLAYGIDHSLNDVKTHLGLVPEISTKPQQYCAAYSIYPHREGILRSITGLEAVVKNPACVWHKVHAQPGAVSKFAKHGGHSLAEFIIATDNARSFAELTDTIEKTIFADID